MNVLNLKTGFTFKDEDEYQLKVDEKVLEMLSNIDISPEQISTHDLDFTMCDDLIDFSHNASLSGLDELVLLTNLDTFETVYITEKEA